MANGTKPRGKRAGVYSKIVKRYPYSAKGQKGSTAVHVLACGHAVLGNPGAAKSEADLVTSWCFLCTKAEEVTPKAKVSGGINPSSLEALIQAAVSRAVEAKLEALTKPSTPSDANSVHPDPDQGE